MTCQRRLIPDGAVDIGVVDIGVVGVLLVGVLVGVLVGGVGGLVVGVLVGAVLLVGVVSFRAWVRGRGVGVRRTRSSGLFGGSGWARVGPGGTTRRPLQAGTSMDRLGDYLLDRAVDQLPAAASARFAEEWRDHRQHYSGWRLVWWALCVLATAMRTVAAFGAARLPHDS